MTEVAAPPVDVPPDAPAPLVDVAGLTFRYRRASEPAIRDVSLTVHPGEVVLVAGPSGCGKSTLIRAINGLIPHAYPGDLTGTVRVDGQLTTDIKLRDIARTVGTVLQDPAKQIVGATVEAELAFGPENIGLDRVEIRERIAAVMAEAGIEALAGRETSALSGGERQLLAVAGILMMRPRLYVVDEPLANLDPETASRLLSLLRTFADSGGAVGDRRASGGGGDRTPARPRAVPRGRRDALPGPARRVPVHRGPSRGEAAVRRRSRAGAARRTRGAPPSGAPRVDNVDADATARLEFRQVDAAIGHRTILHGIDAALGRRQIVAILGPNGSGKTTALRTAMHLLPVTSGVIFVDGVDATDRTTSDLATVFGYVFQSPSQMLFARTVREELVFGPTNLGRDASTLDPRF